MTRAAARALVVGATIVGATIVGAPPAHAFCPSYTLSSPANTQRCGVEAANGTNPTDAEWRAIFDRVSRGPAAWGTAGPAVGDLHQGCGKPEASHAVPARFPCELLEGIAMQESGWRQFCVPDAPADQVGGPARTIIASDCGYGVGQVTSGMHVGETHGFDRARVAADATYNLATGTQIIADKWRATACVGDNQPAIIEDWYAATWAYNGLAYVNNPTNPNYPANRGVWNPAVGGAAPYQEKVFGWIEHTGGRWTPTPLAYPRLADVGGGAAPGAMPDPSCATPTSCATTRPVHATACTGTGGDAGATGDAGTDAPPHGGCGCAHNRGRGGSGEAGALVVVAACAIAARRRRRRRRA